MPARSAPAATPGATAGTGRPSIADIVVDDVDAAVERAVAAGAKLEAAAKDAAYGRIAMLADPFGHGFCLLQFNERGYDALL